MGIKTGVAYFGNRTLRHVQQDMEDIGASGFDYVVHCFTESDLLWGLESMREIVRISHGAGLEVHLDPWGVAGVFGGEALSKYVTWETRSNQVLANGERIGVSCLNQPRLLDWLHNWIDAGIEIDADVMFFDEPHWYPGDLWYLGTSLGPESERWSCRCDLCREMFEAEYGREMPTELDDDVRRFRQDAVLRLSTDLVGYAKSRGKGTALCLLPKGMTFDLVGVPDWEPFGSIAGLDIFGTDPYWRAGDVVPMEPYVRPNAKAVRELCERQGLTNQFWVQSYGMPAGEEHEIAAAIAIAIEEGMTDIAIWSYRCCEPLSALWPERIERSWDETLRALVRARSAQ